MTRETLKSKTAAGGGSLVHISTRWAGLLGPGTSMDVISSAVVEV